MPACYGNDFPPVARARARRARRLPGLGVQRRSECTHVELTVLSLLARTTAGARCSLPQQPLRGQSRSLAQQAWTVAARHGTVSSLLWGTSSRTAAEAESAEAHA